MNTSTRGRVSAFAAAANDRMAAKARRRDIGC
jgi:hypothetical protein